MGTCGPCSSAGGIWRGAETDTVDVYSSYVVDLVGILMFWICLGFVWRNLVGWGPFDSENCVKEVCFALR